MPAFATSVSKPPQPFERRNIGINMKMGAEGRGKTGYHYRAPINNKKFLDNKNYARIIQ